MIKLHSPLFQKHHILACTTEKCPLHSLSKIGEERDINGSALPLSSHGETMEHASPSISYMQNTAHELVLYDPAANGAGEIEAVPDPIAYQPPSFP